MLMVARTDQHFRSYRRLSRPSPVRRPPFGTPGTYLSLVFVLFSPPTPLAFPPAPLTVPPPLRSGGLFLPA